MPGELKQPFTGTHLVNVRLTGPGSEKITRHHEIAIDGHATYAPGDALGAHPHTDPALVERVVTALHATGQEPVKCPDGSSLPLATALTNTYNLSTPSRRLLELFAARGASDHPPQLHEPEKLKH
jgi:sulfite reductase (NADPH) flavoprotein alpha-component